MNPADSDVSNSMTSVKSKMEKKLKKITADSPILKKVDPNTAKLIIKLREEINKKKHGRRINDYEIIDLGVRQLNAVHIKELQERTFSEQDRVQIFHEEFQKTHGKIPMDKMLQKIMRGEVKVETDSFSEAKR